MPEETGRREDATAAAEPGTTPFPVVASQGVDGLLVRFSDRLTEPANRAALALRAALETGAVPGVDEAASALASVYLRIGGDLAVAERALRRLLEDEDFTQAPLPAGRTRWHIPAAFGGAEGPALDAVAAEIGRSRDAAVEELCAEPLRVLAIGFAPGQPYLGELAPHWDIPRLPDLTDVPAGALVVAIRQVVLFANPSPTGWQPVGQTAFRCFRPDAKRPFALAPGDEVRFEPVTAAALASIRASDVSGDGGARREALG